MNRTESNFATVVFTNSDTFAVNGSIIHYIYYYYGLLARVHHMIQNAMDEIKMENLKKIVIHQFTNSPI